MREEQKKHHKRIRTSELLKSLAEDPRGECILLGEILDEFGVRAFGILIILATLPALIPSPIGAGAISGPLVAIAGLQMLLGFSHPWLPKWLSKRAIPRKSIGAFLQRFGKWLARVERLAKPRVVRLFHGKWPCITGLLIMLHAIALSLPIPFTNYPLAFVLLLVGLALIEDDGAILIACWTMMLGAILAIALLSDSLVRLVRGWLS